MKRFLDNYNGESYDVIIIGGGISGASVAYEAASRGLKVALVEKNDFASATSSASSKMIHGGLRYLAQMEFKLVRESLRERRVMMNIAPNFVHPAPFLFSLYNNDKNPPVVYKTGMVLYDLLSFDKNIVWDKNKKMPNHKFISKEEVVKLVPNAKKKGLLGGNLYYDCFSHSPERLTLAFLKSAEHYGANIANYAEMTNFIFEQKPKGKKVMGIEVYDKINDKNIELKSKAVINCAGPWADIVLKKLENKNSHEYSLRRSEGIHFLTKKLIDNYIFAGIDTNKKHFFLIPYRNHTLIGTTDKEFKGNPDNYKVTKESLLELLETVNSSFSDTEKIEYSDILFTYGGLRPLVEEQTEDVYNSSRKYEITDETKIGYYGLFTVEGGKYTTSRSLAEHVIDKVSKKLNLNAKSSISKNIKLVESDIDDIEAFVKEKAEKYNFLSNEQIRYLVYSYGTEIDDLMQLYSENKDLQYLITEDGENLAQVVYAIRNEMAYVLSDILFRRTGIGQLGHPGAEKLNKIANLASKELHWSDQTLNEQIAKAEERFKIPN